MSKNKKAGKNPNPNRPRSKNNPDGKRNDPQINWAQYNKSRQSEGQRYTEWMLKVADMAREILGIPQGKRDWQVSAILVAIVRSEEKISYWGLIKHFDKHPEDLERRGLYRPYSRAQYQLHVSQIKPKVQQEILARMAGEEAVHGTKLVDSSGYSISRYKEWQNAKYGKLSVQDFAKLHLIHTPHGKICAAMVTPGNANDSPYLRKMIKMMPDGSGDVVGDAAYGGIKNCNAIRDSGRRAVIDPKSNATPKGFNARAEMLRFRDEHPRTFSSTLCIRNNVESVFSSMKERFGGVVRALKAAQVSTARLDLDGRCARTPSSSPCRASDTASRRLVSESPAAA